MYFLTQIEAISSLKLLLADPKKIVITTHHKPDGDAMGSSLGLYNYLLQQNHSITVVTPSDYPEFLWWMDGNDKVVNFQVKTAMAEAELLGADIIFCLDFNDADRVENMKNILLSSKAIKIMIDHHLDPKLFCDIHFSYPKAAATSELIYYFIEAMGDMQLINRSVSECLYTGIMTDTGSFRFSIMTASLHRVIARLMEAGARHNLIHERIYDDFSENRLRLLGYCISEKLSVFPQYQAALISLTEQELNKFNFKTGDTEGIVNYGLSMKGILVSAFFSEKNGMIKISFRSKGTISVKEFAENHFQGGGHINAAGGKSFLSLKETVDKFIALLPELKRGT